MSRSLSIKLKHIWSLSTCFHLKKKRYILITFQMFFLVCKLYKLGLYNQDIFWTRAMFYLRVSSIGIHKNCKTKHYFFSNFSWSGKDAFSVCKLYISSLSVQTLIMDVLDVFIDRFLLVAFDKYILPQIYSRYIQNCTF